jgi:hypothetical protein
MQKRDHQQWDLVGRHLYDQAKDAEAEFVKNVLGDAGLTSAL